MCACKDARVHVYMTSRRLLRGEGKKKEETASKGRERERRKKRWWNNHAPSHTTPLYSCCCSFSIGEGRQIAFASGAPSCTSRFASLFGW